MRTSRPSATVASASAAITPISAQAACSLPETQSCSANGRLTVPEGHAARTKIRVQLSAAISGRHGR